MARVLMLDRGIPLITSSPLFGYGNGLGVGLVPDYVVEDAVASGEVLTTLDEWRLSIFGTQMYMLYMPQRHQTRAVRTCIDYLLARARPEQDQPTQ